MSRQHFGENASAAGIAFFFPYRTGSLGVVTAEQEAFRLIKDLGMGEPSPAMISHYANIDVLQLKSLRDRAANLNRAFLCSSWGAIIGAYSTGIAGLVGSHIQTSAFVTGLAIIFATASYRGIEDLKGSAERLANAASGTIGPDIKSQQACTM